MATKTNANVNVAAATVPAPYGPLTRVTDMLTLPVPNEFQQIHLTDANGTHVYMSFEQLDDAEEAQRMIALANGKQYYLHQLIVRLGTINTTVQAIKNVSGHGYTDAEYQTVIKEIRKLNEISGLL